MPLTYFILRDQSDTCKYSVSGKTERFLSNNYESELEHAQADGARGHGGGMDNMEQTKFNVMLNEPNVTPVVRGSVSERERP